MATPSGRSKRAAKGRAAPKPRSRAKPPLRGKAAAKPTPSPDKLLLTGLGEAARAIGKSGFYARLLDVMKHVAPWKVANVVRYSRFAAPHFLINVEGRPAMADLYLSGYYRFDPYYRHWREVGTGGVMTLRGASKPEGLTSDYFTAFLPRTGIVDDLGVMLPSVGGTAIGLFLETPLRRYTPAEAARLEHLYPLFLGLHDAHLARLLSDTLYGDPAVGPEAERPMAIRDREGGWVHATQAWRDLEAGEPALRAAVQRGDATVETAAGMLHSEALGGDSPLAPGGTLYVVEKGRPSAPPISFEAVFGSFAEGQLTRREAQIAKLILSGYPTAHIAKTLGIGVGTVKNHRRRLYDKLDITTERELFSLFLAHLTGAGGAPMVP